MNMQELLTRFQYAAQNPKALKEKYLAEGKKVVLTAPVYLPEEIIHSMGAIPMGAWGADTELRQAKRYFPAFLCSIVQSIVELGMAGAYDGASAIVVPSLCDSLKCLGQNWKYAVPSIPFIPMTYPQNRKPDYAVEFTLAGYRRVIRDLEAATGLSFDEAKLAASLEVYNDHNAAMRTLSPLLAAHPEITCAQRSSIFKSAFFLPKEEHTALVNELIAQLHAAPAGRPALPIVTTGILADAPGLTAILDEVGLTVAADDIAAESRQYRTDAPAEGAPLERLAKKFSAMDHCSVLYDPDKKRVPMIPALAQEVGAKGVLVVLTKFCDPEEFDYPLIKKACDAAGLPCALIEVDRQMTNYEQARTLLEAFGESINA